MAVEITLKQNIAVINGKTYRAHAWYTNLGEASPFFFIVAGRTPLTLEDIGDQYSIIRQKPLSVAFMRNCFPFAAKLNETLRERKPIAYAAVGPTEEAVKISFIAQMNALAVNPEKALDWARRITDQAGLWAPAYMLPIWKLPASAKPDEFEQ